MPAIGSVGAQSFVCELTVVLPTLREEKKKSLRPKEYSEKRIKCD